MTDKLPPLPEPYARVIAYTGKYATGGYSAEVQAESVRNMHERLYTAAQMHAYALAAVMAERERATQIAIGAQNLPNNGDAFANGWCSAAIQIAQAIRQPAAPMEAT